jgi:DNA-binding NarL/FixJ family response regulator
MQILFLSADLMMIAAAQGAADRRGVSLATRSCLDQVAETGVDAAALAFIDLRTPGLSIADAVPQIRRAHPRAKIVACGPHVHRQSLKAAAEAGCDEVITRGEFERRFDGLLAELTASADLE